MYFNAIAKVISDRTGCDIASTKPERAFTELTGEHLHGAGL